MKRIIKLHSLLIVIFIFLGISNGCKEKTIISISKSGSENIVQVESLIDSTTTADLTNLSSNIVSVIDAITSLNQADYCFFIQF